MLKLSPSRRSLSFALAVAVQGETLADLLFVASRFENRNGFGLAAAGTASDIPPSMLSACRTYC